MENDTKQLHFSEKVYIAGKVTGIEEKAFLLFDQAEFDLKNAGYKPVNPMKLDHSDHDKSWESYMKVCIQALCKCEWVYALNNWQDSKGAKMEIDIAQQLGMPIYYRP